jgi:glycosyltransferase involved in cell wall biosynthesis
VAIGGKARYVKTALLASGKPFDLTICGHINLLPLASLLSRVVRAPLVLMVYGIDVWQPPTRVARRWLAGVDAVWSISAITRDRMNAWAKLPETRYTLLPNAIHLERYGMASKRPDLVARHGLADSKVVMTLARLSRLERYKGVDEVLEALPALAEREPAIKYLIAGDGDDRPRLEAKARTLGLADRVIFAGMIDEADKADYFRLADAFAMPGRGEGFGFVFLEALACGVPPSAASWMAAKRCATASWACDRPGRSRLGCDGILSALGKGIRRDSPISPGPHLRAASHRPRAPLAAGRH